MDRHGDYRFTQVTATADEMDEIASLFTLSYGESEIDRDFLDWQYNQNPDGKVVGFNAYTEKELAAHYVCLPMVANVRGKKRRGLLSINTATHPNHQKRGLFTSLAQMTFEYGKAQGYEFVVGVANQNSVHGFVKKLGFQLVGQLQTRVVVTLRKHNHFVALDFERTWNRESVEWRLSNPLRVRNGQDYKVKSTRAGMQILGRTARFPALVGILEHEQIPLSISRAGRITPPRIWIGIDDQIDWDRSLQVRVPARFKSVPLNLIYRDLVGDTTLREKHVKFWAMDFDAY